MSKEVDNAINASLLPETIPYSNETIRRLAAIESQHVAHWKYPELSCGCGCDRDSEEMDSWTDDDYYAICLFCTSNNVYSGDPEDLDLNDLNNEEYSNPGENYFGEITFPCPTLIKARETAAPETTIAVALVLGKRYDDE